LLDSIAYSHASDNPTAGDRTLSFTAEDSDSATTATAAVSTITVIAVNDAPVLPTLADITVAENTANITPQFVAASAGLPTDVDSSDFNGGSLTISYSTGGGVEDQLTINNEGTGAGEIGISGSTITFGGDTIGTFSGGTNGAALAVTFTTDDATPAAVQALLQNLLYQNLSNDPAASRTLSMVLVDGDGTANGGMDTSAAELVTINVTPEDDTVAITANVATASEPGTDGQFTVSLSGATGVDVVVNYVVLGSSTAGAGTDYVALSGSVTILAGQTTATIDVEVVDDILELGWARVSLPQSTLPTIRMQARLRLLQMHQMLRNRIPMGNLR